MLKNRHSLGVALAFGLLSFAAIADSYWQGTTGGDLTAGDNWDPRPAAGVKAFVQKAQSAPFTVSADPSFFGGAMLRYDKSGNTYTNDFGAGAVLNVGATSETGLHVENGANLVHASGCLSVTGTTSSVLYITENSTLTVTGPDAEIRTVGSVILRTNAQKGTQRYPRLEVLDGAKLTTSSQLSVGAQTPCAFGRVLIADEGSKLTANIVSVGSTVNKSAEQPTPYCETNALEVSDGGELVVNLLKVGDARDLSEVTVRDGGRIRAYDTIVGNLVASSNCTLTVAAGGILTNDGTLAIGYVNNGAFPLNDRLLVTGAGASVYAGGAVYVRPGGSVLVDNGGIFGLRYSGDVTCSQDAATGVRGLFRVGAGGTLRVMNASPGYGNYVNLAPFANCDLADGVVRTEKDLQVKDDNVTLEVGALLTDKTLSVQASGMVVSNATVGYSKLYLNKTSASIEFNGCNVEGGRFEMSNSNVLMRLVNTTFKVTKKDGSDYFMLGDGGGVAPNIYYERALYIGGTNTHVVVDDSSNGIYFRCTNVTFNVDIPAEGFSTTSPVFQWTKASGQGDHICVRVNVTVDPQLCYNGGGEYVLLKGPEATSETRFRLNYDSRYVRIIRDTAKKELRVKAKNLNGTLILLR